MDDDEPARFEEHGAYSLLVVDMPVLERHGKADAYRAYPLSIITAANGSVITTSRIDFASLDREHASQRKVTIVDGKSRLVYDLLLSMAASYQRYLRAIECRRAELVSGLDRHTKVSDLVALHGLEADIVYLETSPLRQPRRARTRRPQPAHPSGQGWTRRSSTTSSSKFARQTRWRAPTASSSPARASCSRASWTTA